MMQKEIRFGTFLVKINWLYEAIVTTCNVESINGKVIYNAAPMGVLFPDQDHIMIRPFQNTNTFKNIQHYGCACINFTNNILIFYKSAIKKSEISQNDFLTSRNKKIPFLRTSYTYFTVLKEKIEINKSEKRAKIWFKIKDFEIIDSNLRPYHRGFSIVLESIIHYTRIKFLIEKDPNRGKKLISKIRDYKDFIERIYPDSDLQKIMRELVLKINKIEPIF
ncbi:MAG: DUF447 domain-containing protein [Candidatus Helarchaeota archaeon]